LVIGILLVPALVQASQAPESLEPAGATASRRSGSPAYASSAVVDDQEEELRLNLVGRTALSGLGDWDFRTWLGGSLGGDGDLDDGGTLEVSRIGVRLEAWRSFGRRDELHLEWSFEESGYDFSDDVGVEAMDGVYLSTLQLRYQHAPSRDFEWRFHAALDLGSEEGARVAEGFVFRGGVTAVFPIHNRLDIEAGGFAWTRLEDDPLVVPYATVDWRPTDALEISSDGLNIGVKYDWGRDVRTYTTLGFVERQYRLDEAEVGLAVFDEAVAREDEIGITGGIVLPWYPRLQLELFGGYAVRDLTFLDARGREVYDDTSDPTYFFGLGLSYGAF